MCFVLKMQRGAPVWERRAIKKLIQVDGASLVNVMGGNQVEMAYITTALPLHGNSGGGDKRERGIGKVQNQAKIRSRVMNGFVKEIKGADRVGDYQVGTSTPVDGVSVEQTIYECRDTTLR